MKTRQAREVRQIEMVETYNLCNSIKRLKDAPNYDEDRWKRALHHALGMSYCNRSELEKIRIALGLP